MRIDREYRMWLLIIVTLVTGTDGGASSSVTTLQFTTQGNCAAGKGTYAIKANCVQP
jgi:hypothetical protein